jgi:branched-subunit amino acid ABC-type transport system permease component
VPSFDQVGNSVVDGLLLGIIYAVAAMGLTLIFGVMRVVNLAHGALITAGMFATFVLSIEVGLPVYLSAAIAAVGGFALGVLIYWMSVHRLLGKPELTTLLSTFATSIMLIGLGTAIFSTTPRNIDVDIGSIDAGVVRLQGPKLIAAAIALGLIAGLYVFLYRTTPGKKIQAVADNRSAAELVGIPSARMLAQAFGVGTLLAAGAGALIATLFPFTVLRGGVYELKSFVIVVLGGLGNVTGALVGGIILGLIEGIVPLFWAATWTPVIEFGLFVLVLLLRPQGLLARAG